MAALHNLRRRSGAYGSRKWWSSVGVRASVGFSEDRQAGQDNIHRLSILSMLTVTQSAYWVTMMPDRVAVKSGTVHHVEVEP